MTVEARYAQHAVRPVGSPVLGGVELLLRELGEQEPQSFELLGVQDAVEDLVVVLDRDEAVLGHVTEVRPGREIHGGDRIGKDWLG